MTAAERALEFVNEGDRVGLGTGRAASAFVRALAERVRQGLRVRAVATSEATAADALSLGIPLVTLDAVDTLDLTVDGADEVDPHLDVIKGLGGALLRERVVATVSRQFIILVGPEKLVPMLGTRGTLPVEVVPFALPFCRRHLAELGMPAVPRMDGGRLFLTDNGNVLLQCAVRPMPDPAAVLAHVRSIPGVVEVGLFLGLADLVLTEQDGHVQEQRRRHAG
jgi:ribose 5-phosphate isomerase A